MDDNTSDRSRGDEYSAIQILNTFRNEYDDPKEDQLMREVPYAIQGLETTHFPRREISSIITKPTILDDFTDHTRRLSSSTEPPMTETVIQSAILLPRSLPLPAIARLTRILEPGLLYQRLREFVDDLSQSHGLVKQSLQGAISKELYSYLACVGALEAAIRANPTTMTPRRVTVLLHDATLSLRMMDKLVTDCKEMTGGQVLSIVWNYQAHGDRLIADFATRMMRCLCTSFDQIVERWIGGGELVDPHDEFFVKRNIENNNNNNNINNNNRYNRRENNNLVEFSFDTTKTPQFIEESVWKKVFQIGKTLYFLRVQCDDGTWIDLRRSHREDVTVPVWQDQAFTQMIEREYEDVVKRLNYVFMHSLGLHLHLRGLKDYLLLNKGDFVQVLLENVAPVLIRPANLLYRHDLTSKLETAVRSSNAFYDSPEVLKCVDARMLELGHGDIGWDVFTLDYHLDGALQNVILDQESRTEYLRVFNFLWRLRRVSYILSQSWRDLRPSSLNKSNSNNTSAIRVSARSACTSMTHFISELHYYITYEVIATSWTQLQKGLASNLSTVDDIKAVHKRYLERIKHKGLLGGGAKLMSELHGILKDIVIFGEVTSSIDEVEVANDDQRTAKVTETIYRVKRSFERRVERMVTELGKFDDEELRFLGIRFDFNGYYTRAREARDHRDRTDRMRSEEARNERKRKEGAV